MYYEIKKCFPYYVLLDYKQSVIEVVVLNNNGIYESYLGFENDKLSVFNNMPLLIISCYQ